MRWTARRWRGWCARSAGSWTRPRRSRRPRRARYRSSSHARWARRGWRTGCGSALRSARRSSTRPASGGLRVSGWSGRSSRWSQTACRSSRCRSSPAVLGSPSGRSSRGLRLSLMTSATGRWTSCTPRFPSCRSGCSSRSRACSISRSTCCSLTPPRPTGRPTGCQTSCRTKTTRPIPMSPTRSRRFRSRAGVATRRTARITVPICRRWWSGWRSRARGSRSGCGRSPATRLTR